MYRRVPLDPIVRLQVLSNAKMLPALARGMIETYSERGDLVAYPMCGIGTTLVKAADLGRPAVGVELEPSWWCA